LGHETIDWTYLDDTDPYPEFIHLGLGYLKLSFLAVAWHTRTCSLRSVTIVTDCQKFSHFLPVAYQIGILVVKVLKKFQSSDNHICNLFSKKAEIGVKNIFSQYASQIHDVYDLKKKL